MTQTRFFPLSKRLFIFDFKLNTNFLITTLYQHSSHPITDASSHYHKSDTLCLSMCIINKLSLAKLLNKIRELRAMRFLNEFNWFSLQLRIEYYCWLNGIAKMLKRKQNGIFSPSKETKVNQNSLLILLLKPSASTGRTSSCPCWCP